MADPTNSSPSIDVSISAGGDTSWMNDIMPTEGEGPNVVPQEASVPTEAPTPTPTPAPDCCK